ncbi:30S ribosomal protein S1, partial [Francisellaceae bacterium]|nr:30S ribosomal protein S1 [Francisellaceae bacterium]
NGDIDLKIIKLDPKRNNIVVSRRAVIEAETQVEREQMLEKLTEGSEIQGIVKNITDFGAFIDLGGIDGLLHITDMSWSRIKHPSAILSVGDEINVKVIKFDREKGRISLGMKQLGSDPWENIQEKLPVGTKVKGEVTNITDYGCFVKLEEGIEGLVHTSEMDWSNKSSNPHKLVVLDQEVQVVVLDMDAAKHRISLGMKQCTINPWQAFANDHQPGSKVKGTIRSVTDFGIFIGLEGGIDGLIHISDISWTKQGEEAIKDFKKGEDIEAVMISVDVDRERIALGIKQISDDPFTQFTEVNDKGATVKGTVSKVQQNGAEVDLGNDIKAFIRVADISSHHVENAGDELKEGQEIEARISNIDKKRRSINLSIKALDEMPEKGQDQMTATTIGDLIKEKMKK